MNCPRCSTPLHEVTPGPELPSVHGQGCAHCHGVWLEARDVERLGQTVEVRWIEVRHLPPDAIQEAPLTCPRCEPEQPLSKSGSARDRRVVLDVCSACHGVWLDGGELEAIREMGVGAALVDAVRFLLGR